MNLLRRFRGYAYLLVFLSILGFTYAEHNPALLFFSVLAIAVSWWIVERPGGRILSRWLINIGVLLASLALFYELVFMPPESLLLALGHFMVLILLCKLFETKSNRDYAQILTLSLLVIVTGAIFSSTLFFATILACYLALGLYTVLLFHLRAEVERTVGQSDRVAVVAPDPAMGRDIRIVAAGSGAVLLIFASLIFLIFPRDRGREFFSSWSLNRGMGNGLADRVILGDISRLQQSDALVMEVHLEQNGYNIGSEADQYYYRAMTLDVYDTREKQWIRSEPGGYSERHGISAADGDLPIVNVGDDASWLITQTYTLTNPTGNNLFAIAEPVHVRCSQVPLLRYIPRGSMIVAGSPMRDVQSPLVSGLQYQVDSVYRWPPGYALPTPRLALFGMMNHADPLVRQPLPRTVVEKVREWAGPLLIDGPPRTAQAIREVADTFVRQLRTGYAYSLQTHVVDTTLDPTADFLANRQTIGGHCEYFASAMVMLCTEAGIPARLAVGYHGGEYNAVGGFYTVRQRNAHAWVEVFIPEEGWVTFDPTPPGEDADVAASFGWIRWLRECMQTLEHEWVSSIVTFDNNTRRYLAEQILAPIMAFVSGFWASVRLGGGAVTDLFFSNHFSWPKRLFLTADLLTLAGTAIWLLQRFRRYRRSAVRAMLGHVDRTARKRLAVELAFFDDFLRILRRSGLPRRPHQTPAEYASVVCKPGSTAAADAGWIIQQFYDIRFGGSRATPELCEQVGLTLARLRREIRRGNPARIS